MTTAFAQAMLRASASRTLWLLVVSFAISRAAAWELGLRFNVSKLDLYWQFVDPFLLRRELATSLLHLHSQPPLFNLLLGLALVAGRDHLASVLQPFYWACGLAVLLGMHRLQRRLGVPEGLAVATSLAWVVSPAFLLHENWLFYSLPTAALVTWTCVFFVDALDGRAGAAAACLWVAAMLCLTRASFHPLGFVALAAVLARWRGRRVLWAAVVPGLLLAAVVGKNVVLFGSPSLSSWVGMSVSRLTVERLPAAERERQVEVGVLSPAARLPSFSRPETYPEPYFRVERGLPRVLSQREKSAGDVNYHHIGYLRVSRDLAADSLRVAVRQPHLYLAAVAEAWAVYLRSPCAVPFFGIENRRTMSTLCEAQDRVLLGRLPLVGPFQGLAPRASDAPCVALWVGLPLLALLGAAGALGRGPLGRGPDPHRRALLGLMVALITWVALVGNALELGENNRFRFDTDALSVVLLGVTATALLRLASTTPNCRETPAASPRPST